MLSKFTTKTSRVLIAIGATMLACMMFLTVADVVLRGLFNHPIAGAFELVEYMMAVMVPFSITYCAEQNGHIAVDLIMNRFSLKFQRVTDIVITFATLIFIIVIAWQNVLYFMEVKAFQVTSSVLLIPTYPFVTPIFIAFGVFALILVVQLSNLFSEVKN
ncbi:TRAP transporter small permease [Desulfocicer niacini]